MNMTMTYDGTMVMPKNFAVVTEDEMTYVDGGDAANFANNLKALWSLSEPMRHALRMGGFNWGYLCSLATASYFYVVGTVAAKLGITIALVSRTLAVVAALGTVAAATYVWNKRIWY